MAGAAKNTPKIRKPKLIPLFGQGPKVAQFAGGLEDHRSGLLVLGIQGLASADSHQAIDDAVEFSAELIETTQRGDGALLDETGFVTKGFNELDLATGAGGGDLHKHATTFAQTSLMNE